MQLTSCLVWSVASISMNIINKEVANRFKSHNETVCIQMLGTSLLSLPFVELAHGWDVWVRIVPLLFVGMLVTSMYALEFVTIGSFTIARNAGPIVTYAFEVANGTEKITLLRIVVLSGLIGGSFIYEWGNISFTPFGLMLIVFNILFGTCERYAQKRLMALDSMKCSKTTLSFLNNSVGFMVLVLWLTTMEYENIVSTTRWLHHSTTDLLFMGLSCFMATFISWSGLWAQQNTSLTEFMVLGCFTKMLLVLYAIAVYGDSSTDYSTIGIMLSFTSAVAFGFREQIESAIRHEDVVDYEEKCSLSDSPKSKA